MFWLFVLLFACMGCDKSYTVHESYVENRRWDADKGVVKSSQTTVKYEWE